MGVKFIMDRRCSVKTSLSLIGLIEALKLQGLVRRVGDLVAAGVLTTGDPETRLDQVMDPESGIPRSMTIRELQEQASVLKEHRITCRQCPSSLHGSVGGCVAYLPYPLSEGVEWLFWFTAVQELEGKLPESVQPQAAALVERARALRRTPLAAGLRSRGDLLGEAPRVHATGRLWNRSTLSSEQVLEAFFTNGVISGDDLRVHAGFLGAVLAMAQAMEPAMSSTDRLVALLEDIEPYQQVHELMLKALEQGLGVYVWP